MENRKETSNPKIRDADVDVDADTDADAVSPWPPTGRRRG